MSVSPPAHPIEADNLNMNIMLIRPESDIVMLIIVNLSVQTPLHTHVTTPPVSGITIKLWEEGFRQMLAMTMRNGTRRNLFWYC